MTDTARGLSPSLCRLQEVCVVFGCYSLRDLPKHLVVFLEKIGRDRHLAARHPQEEGFQVAIRNRRETMLVNDDMQKVTRLRFALMEQDSNVVDTIETLTLLEEPAALDRLQELLLRNSLQKPLSFRGELVG